MTLNPEQQESMSEEKKKLREQIKQGWRRQDRQGEEFPPACKAFLESYYAAKDATTEAGKLRAIKDFYESRYDFEELKVAEFFVLTNLKMI